MDPAIRMIWRQVEHCQSTFLSPSNLKDLGIEAREIDATDSHGLRFAPCFFDPYPKGVLQKYPIDAEAMDYDVRRLVCIPTLPDALNKVKERPNAPKDPLEAAQRLLESKLEDFNSWDPYTHAMQIQYHIEYELSAERKGGLPNLTLQSVAGLRKWTYVNRDNYAVIETLVFTFS